MLNDDNPVTALCQAVARLGEHRFPVRVTDTTRAFVAELSDALGVDLDPYDTEQLTAVLGPLADSRRDTIGPWVFDQDNDETVTVLAGLRARLGEGTRVDFAPGVRPGQPSRFIAS